MALSKQLLKFSAADAKAQDNDGAHLSPDGLDFLRGLEGTICPVIFMGDGRGGKSYLASRLLGGDEKGPFFSSDAAVAVTEGIDVYAAPVSQLQEGLQGIPPPDPRGEHILIFDCEGGNNAMAAIHTLVNVFGIIVGTQVVFVAAGMVSEAALQNLGASLAARSLIRFEGSSKADQHLTFVVNKNMLRYEDDALEKLLTQSHDDAARAELRESILGYFENRTFIPIPMLGMPEFDDRMNQFRTSILKNRRPLSMGGTIVDGPSLCGLLELVVEEIRDAKEVSFPSMHRHVILDGFLLPLANDLIRDAELRLPKLEDYDPDLAKKDCRADVMKDYDSKVGHIVYHALVDEGRKHLSSKLNDDWSRLVQLNDSYGDQVKEMVTETREVAVKTSAGHLGGRGLLSKVVVTRQTMRVDSRAKIFKKRGGEPQIMEWNDTGTQASRMVESAFEFVAQLPVLRGRLWKRSPSLVKKILTFGLANPDQERACVLKDAHFIWWEPDNMHKEANGCINFILHRAVVEEMPGQPSVFVIKPSESVWHDSMAFTGGAQRQFIFDAEKSEVSAKEWIAAINKHIEFANKAMEQIGEQRALVEIGSQKPTLAQVDGNCDLREYLSGRNL